MRIACIADTHLTVPEFESFSLFPRQLCKLEYGKAKEMYDAMRREISLAYETCLARLAQNRPWDMIVHLGDITGGYQEQGCRQSSARQIIYKVSADLRSISPLTRFVIGDHDTGYSHPGSLHGSGISITSLDILRDLLGNLFWAVEDEKMLHIGVCSPLAEYSGPDDIIIQQREDQLSFVGDTLSSWTKAAPRPEWVLYIHRPSASKCFAKEIGSHVKWLKKMVYGHFHDPKKAGLIQLAAKMAGGFTGQCMSKGLHCPSTAPLWWPGYQFLAIEDSQTMESRRIAINRPTDGNDLPMSSFWRCLWWMLRPK